MRKPLVLRADLDQLPLGEILPLLRRALELDPAALLRLRADGQVLTAFVPLPFGVLAARALPAVLAGDATLGAAEAAAWGQGLRLPPPPRDGDWRGSLPPRTGWHRLDVVPDAELRPLVRAGALRLAGLSPGQAQGLLDAVVLTVTPEPGGAAPSSAPGGIAPSAGLGGAAPVEVSLRLLSALFRMGFVPRGTAVAVESNGRWKRLVAQFGTVYAEPAGLRLA